MLKEYRTLLPYMRKYLWFYVAGLVALAVTSGGQLFIPQLIRIAIDAIAAGEFGLRRITLLMLQLCGLAAVIALGRFGWRYFIHGASRRIEVELRGDLFAHLLRLSPSYYARTRTGDLMARATNDLQAIRMASGMALVAAADGIFMTLAILVILFLQMPPTALITVLPLPLISILIVGLGRTISSRFKRVQEGFSRLSEHTQEAFTGIRVIKSFVKERYFLGRFGEANSEYQRRNLELVLIWGLFMPAVAFLSGLTLLILLRFGGVAVILRGFTPGEFVATLNYLEMLTWPMVGAGFTVNVIQRGAASLGRINQVLGEQPEILGPPDGLQQAPHSGIEVRALSFRYSEDSPHVLSNVSFRIEAGKSLGILGRTGSGKTTLVKTLPRLIDPPLETVLVGGAAVQRYELGALRELFGVVPQDGFLFSSTVRENLAFGVDDASDELLRYVAEVATIDRDLELFPHGWDTVVGERGITLSGGQKQRIAIARALAKNPEILILDDSLSAVDTETEEHILTALLENRHGKTTVIVSHRVSTLQRADQIIVLDDGRITQSGTHRELAACDGFYREIFTIQQLEKQLRH